MTWRFVIPGLGVLLLGLIGCDGSPPKGQKTVRPEAQSKARSTGGENGKENRAKTSRKTVVLADVWESMVPVLSAHFPLDDAFVRQVRVEGDVDGLSHEALEEKIRRIVCIQVATKVQGRDAVYCRVAQKRLPDSTWAIKRDSAEFGTFEEASGTIDVEVLGVEGHLTYRIEPEVKGKVAQRDHEDGVPPYDVKALEFWMAFDVHLEGIVPGEVVHTHTVPYMVPSSRPDERAD
ncbi:MAG: hypothetical protein GF350_16880 [Chitinivibrionales bacterium]|nr:hypothetical protein [Chitinivibrionales bacterium]